MILLKNIGRRRTKNGNSQQSWGLFLCPACGQEVEKHLGNGQRDSSCGCLHYKGQNFRHGKCNTKLYGIWLAMKARCRCETDAGYKYYGARGILVCAEWNDFNVFELWAKRSGYKIGLTIDRINNDGNYEPLNCRFVTHTENMQNSRVAKLDWYDVNLIRQIYSIFRLNKREISELFPVSADTIGDIVEYRTWR